MLWLLVLALLLVPLIWVGIHTARMPKKPQHERDPERFRDPAITAYKGGPSGGV
jgi:hypothetical protein